jgi:hypothetical protein
MSGPDKSEDSRAARLAEALRANLRRRKNQARARKQATEAEGAEPGERRPQNGRDERRDGRHVPRG